MRFANSEMVIDLVRHLGTLFAVIGTIGTVISWVNMGRRDDFEGYPFMLLAIAGLGIFIGCTTALAQIVTAHASIEALRKLDEIKAATESRPAK